MFRWIGGATAILGVGLMIAKGPQPEFFLLVIFGALAAIFFK